MENIRLLLEKSIWEKLSKKEVIELDKRLDSKGWVPLSKYCKISNLQNSINKFLTRLYGIEVDIGNDCIYNLYQPNTICKYNGRPMFFIIDVNDSLEKYVKKTKHFPGYHQSDILEWNENPKLEMKFCRLLDDGNWSITKYRKDNISLLIKHSSTSKRGRKNGTKISSKSIMMGSMDCIHCGEPNKVQINGKEFISPSLKCQNCGKTFIKNIKFTYIDERKLILPKS